MNQIKVIPLFFHFQKLCSYQAAIEMIDPDAEYVAILKSDLDRLNETEKWRQLQAQLLSVQESALTSEQDKLCDDCGGPIGDSF